MSGWQKFFGPVEAFRGNADDGVRLLVDADRLSHDVGIGAEITLPGRPGNHGRLRGSGMIVIGALQQTPEERLDADHLEVLPADFASPDRPGDAIGFEAKIFDRVKRPPRKTPCSHRARRALPDRKKSG